MSKEINYNKIPVHFCKTCLSLKILKLESSNVDYCGKCGNTEISTSSLEVWEDLYKTKNGKYYIE